MKDGDDNDDDYDGDDEGGGWEGSMKRKEPHLNFFHLWFQCHFSLQKIFGEFNFKWHLKGKTRHYHNNLCTLFP